MAVSSYHVHGAYAHLGKDCPNEASKVIASATKHIYSNDLIWISVAYIFFQEKTRAPPNNALLCVISFLSIAFIYFSLIGCCLWDLKRRPVQVTSDHLLEYCIGILGRHMPHMWGHWSLLCHWWHPICDQQLYHLHHMQWQKSTCQSALCSAAVCWNHPWHCMFWVLWGNCYLPNW